MIEYYKKFATHAEYENYMGGGDLILPNVSICADNLDVSHVHYNPVDQYDGYDYVDLGLPSGLLWAMCNIGAKKPTDYGDYFMWGSTEPDTDKPCDWTHCPFNDGIDIYNERYFNSVKDTVCPMGTLAPQYDAVHAIMGGNWRMPTYDDFTELLTNTNNTWVANYQGSGINGTLFTSNTDTSKTLFIPASGYRGGSGFDNRGSYASLWSSSLNAGSPNYAWNLYFYDYSCDTDNSNRYDGFCLRGVCK